MHSEFSPPSDPSREQRGSRGFSIKGLNIAPFTLALIVVSAAVAYISSLGDDDATLSYIFISESSTPLLSEVRSGQVWRLVTPIFIHFGLIHIVFNMLCLKDLGTVIERRSTARTLLALVIVSGIVSNLVQYYFRGPYFGGMSGVVYALFGYVWMQAKFNPASGYLLPKETVYMMIGWFALCAFGVIGAVANHAHSAGLVLGVLWGFIAAKMRPAHRRPATMFSR